MEPDGDKATIVGCPSETVSSVSLETTDRGELARILHYKREAHKIMHMWYLCTP